MEPAEYALMDEAEGRMWWYRALHARLLEALAGVTWPVLDAGCGTGGLLAGCASAGPTCSRSASNGTTAAAARARAKSGAPIVRGSVNALPFADASFDAAIAADVLCHAAVEPARGAGRAAPRAAARRQAGGEHAGLSPGCSRRMTGGCTTPAARPPARPPRCCAQAGFRDVRARYWNGLLLPLMVVQRKLLARGDAASDVAAFPPWLDPCCMA